MKSCFECGSTEKITRHHVVPVVLGGKNTIPLCSSCHGKVHDRKGIGASELTKLGQSKLREQGKRISRTPYGFDVAPDGKHLVENKSEQKGIETILALRKSGLSFPKIAGKLDKLGIKTKRGNEWNQGSVNGIIRRHRKNNEN